METSEAIGRWRSIRRYEEKDVPDEVLAKILEAGRRAPSWENVQPWHFIIVRERETKEKLSALCKGQKHVARAPVLILCCGDLSAWDKPKNKEALLELVEAGAMKATPEIIDKVFMNDPMFCVAETGPAMIVARTFEAVATAWAFMGIEAVNRGLGMCVVGAMGNEATGGLPEVYGEVRALLGLPDLMHLLCLLTLGYPAEEPKARPRKALSRIVSVGKYGEGF